MAMPTYVHRPSLSLDLSSPQNFLAAILLDVAVDEHRRAAPRARARRQSRRSACLPVGPGHGGACAYRRRSGVMCSQHRSRGALARRGKVFARREQPRRLGQTRPYYAPQVLSNRGPSDRAPEESGSTTQEQSWSRRRARSKAIVVCKITSQVKSSQDLLQNFPRALSRRCGARTIRPIRRLARR